MRKRKAFWKQANDKALEQGFERADIGDLLHLLPAYYLNGKYCGIHSCLKVYEEMMDRINDLDPQMHTKIEHAFAVIHDRSEAMLGMDNKETTSETANLLAEAFLDELDMFEPKPDEQKGDGEEDESNESQDSDGSGDSDQNQDSSESGDDQDGAGGSDQGEEGDSSESQDGSGQGQGESQDQGDDSESGNGNSQSGDDSKDQGNNPGQPSQGQCGSKQHKEIELNPEGKEHAGVRELKEIIEEIQNDPDYSGVPMASADDLDLADNEIPENKPYYDQVMSEVTKESSELEYHIEDLIQELTMSSSTFHEEGDFTDNSVERFITRDEHVFERIQRAETPTRHLSILLDSSGSMHGDERHVIKATGMLINALEALDASYSIHSFGGSFNVVKRVDEDRHIAEARLGGLPSVTSGGTPMGDALMATIDEVPNDADENEVIIITDGSPYDPKKVIEEADYGLEEGVNTHILSVGINPTWANGSCITTEHVTNFNHIDQHLINLVEKILLREVEL